MLQSKAGGWFSRSGVPRTSWQRDSMVLYKDSNLSRPRPMYMDQSKGMELVHKPTRYVLVLVPKLTTQDVHHP
jgi:hypothetical protein